MHDTAEGDVASVEPHVMGGVDTGAERAREAVWHSRRGHRPTLEVHHREILRPQPIVVDAAGLDQDEAALAMDPAGVAAVHGHEARAGQLDVGPEDFLAQGSECVVHVHPDPPCQRRAQVYNGTRKQSQIIESQVTMAFVLRFVQRFQASKEREFLALERKFARLERRRSSLPRGRRMRPYAGRDSTHTLVWECEFPTLAAAEQALARLSADLEHARLLKKQIPFFLEAWTEIYEVLEF